MPKLISIVGPTASGKSDLAIFLAQKIGGEIISADSRQVYKNLDIGTNKVPGTWVHKKIKEDSKSDRVFLYKKIPHHCIDFVDVANTYTVSDFKKCADIAIQKIDERGHIPLLVGGTGFYIDSVVYGIIPPEVPPNKKLRKDYAGKTTKELFTILQNHDPTRAEAIDPNNPRRLMRAIEISKALGTVPDLKKWPSYHTLILGIKRSKKEMEERIRSMVYRMIDSGLIDETKLLIKHGLSEKRIRELGYEYSVVWNYINTITNNTFGGVTSEGVVALIDTLIQKNRQYAKRQMTWFKRDKNIHWITTSEEAERHIQPFIK